MIDLSEMLKLPDLQAQLKEVDKYLLAAVKSDNSEITKAASRIVKAGGKRLRPSLVIAGASIKNQDANANTLKLAAAVELLHLGSLVHDDIIDEADSRWNIPTINAQEGPNQAILIGDYLLSAACSLAASVGKKEAKLVADTVIRLCEGQYYELSDQFNVRRSQEAYYRNIDGKTAALLSLACVLGAISAALNGKQIDMLDQYGHNFGRSFQLIDDLMDLVSTDELYGKPVGNDVVEGVYTLPVILGLQGSESRKIEDILASKKFDPQLTQVLLKTGVIKQILATIHDYNRRAAASMQEFSGDIASALGKLPDFYLDWALSNLVSKSYSNKLTQTA